MELIELTNDKEPWPLRDFSWADGEYIQLDNDFDKWSAEYKESAKLTETIGDNASNQELANQIDEFKTCILDLGLVQKIDSIKEGLTMVTDPTIHKGRRVHLLTEKEVCAWLNKSWRWVRTNFRTVESHTAKNQPRFYNKYDILEKLEKLGLLELAQDVGTDSKV